MKEDPVLMPDLFFALPCAGIFSASGSDLYRLFLDFIMLFFRFTREFFFKTSDRSVFGLFIAKRIFLYYTFLMRFI